uniref:Uncharacterized protein n=1 Tax=Avena sativa TaxID=4498 RepID=A0ACD5XTI1_AVESA
MDCGYVLISILLCFSYYVTLVRSVDADNLQTNEKNDTHFKPLPFKFAKSQDGSNIISHYAMWHTQPGNFYGLRAEISIWGYPDINYSQESGASIQIYCQDGGHFNLIEAGFHVSPSLYHNRDVRFFTYWTNDSKLPGCYNFQCPGFVSASGALLVPGQAVAPPSSYGQYDHYVRLSLNKDPNSGDWVVYRHDLGTPQFLGYFPVKLCPTMPLIQALTGFVNYFNTTNGPPMGSGHFPDENDRKYAYFKHIKKYHSNGHPYDPIVATMVPFNDRRDCYKVTDFQPDIGKGYVFHYGGPGGCIG